MKAKEGSLAHGLCSCSAVVANWCAYKPVGAYRAKNWHALTSHAGLVLQCDHQALLCLHI